MARSRCCAGTFVLIAIAVVCEGLPTTLDIYLGLAHGGPANAGLGTLSRLLGALGRVLVRGATIWVVSEGYLGRTPRLGEALRVTGERWVSCSGRAMLSQQLGAAAHA